MSIHSLSHRWRGSTLADPYPRNAVASASGKADIDVSAAASFHGSDARWNPEDLLGASLVQCHTLTYLALAAKVGVDVRAIDTEVSVHLEKGERTQEVTRIEVHSLIRVAPDADAAKAAEMFAKAEKYCFIANSLKGEVVATCDVTADAG